MAISHRSEIAEGRNAVILLAAVGGNIACLAGSAAAYQHSTLLFAALVIAFAYCSLLSWLVIHECIHYSLFRTRALNVPAGRAVSVLFGCPYYVLRAGHLMHHKLNRSEVEPSELLFEQPRNVALRWLEYYGWLLGLFHIGQMLFPLILPFRTLIAARAKRRESMALNDLLRRLQRTYWVAAFDGCLCLVFLALVFALNAESVVAVLLLLYARALIISFHDNLYHYGTTPRDPFAAYNLQASGLFQQLILNSNYHRTHHRYPRVPWDRLPAAFAAAGDRFDDKFARAAVRQLQGPIAADPIGRADAGQARTALAG